MLDEYYSNSAPSYGMIEKQFTEFRCGNVLRAQKPYQVQVAQNKIITPEMINKIHDIVLMTRNFVRELRLYPFQLSVWSIFRIHICAWESSGRMCATTAHNRPKMNLCDHFSEKFGLL